MNTGKIITPSLITTELNKYLEMTFTTNKTVSNYLDKICKSNLVHKLDREYIPLSRNETNKLSYNRTYYFSDHDLFEKFYNYALEDLFKHRPTNTLSYDIAVAKMLFYHTCISAGYNVKSGVLSYFTHFENGKTKKNTLNFDFIINTGSKDVYVVFQNDKDFDKREFTLEAKFALTNIINEFSILVVTTSSDFLPLENQKFNYISINKILNNRFEI